ncbi:ead/Ea22-like family protein [Escherichia coli]
MSKIDYQALRAKAEKATCGVWSLEYGEGRFDGDDALIHREVAGYLPICRIEGAHPESGFDEDFQMEQQANAEFIAAANPATVLALLDELERNQQYIKSRDQENEDIALTVGRLRVELEGKDSKIANLTAERDALREGEMGDARHSNTRAAADIYFQLVEECEIPAGGSLVEYVDDMREKLEAAEKRIAELSASHSKLRDTMAGIHNTIRMDGGYTPLAAILNAAKRAYEESASAAGIRIKGE